MTLDDGIRIQLKIIKRTELLSILDCIRKDVEGYYKEENKKENITNYRNKINIKKRHIRKLCIRILEEIINILRRQE